MIYLHPAIVHFPIALLTVSVVLDVLGVIFHRSGFTQFGFAALIVGGLGAGGAALTGPNEAVKDAAAHDLLIRHELFAAVTILISLILIGVRIGNVRGLHGPAIYGYLGGGIALIVAVAITGYWGGEMTYGYGVGVRQLQGAPVNGDQSQVLELWAKLGGITLIVVILGYGVYVFREQHLSRLKKETPRWTLDPLSDFVSDLVASFAGAVS